MGCQLYTAGHVHRQSSLRQLLKTNPDFLRVCQQFGWGKIEIAVKDGKPVMISVKRDIKIE